MLKRFSLLTLLCFVLNGPTVAQNDNKPKILATASMIADMARNICGNLAEVESIVPIGGDPHLFEPTPSDAQRVNHAQMILVNGLSFEGWINELIENSGTRATIVTVTKGIEPITSEVYLNAFDPHAWMDAHNGLTYIRNIRDAIIGLDPSNKEYYEDNYRTYEAKIIELDGYIREKIQTIPQPFRILVTSHDAFQYYGRRYGIRLESILGTSTDADVQTADIIRLNRVIKESGIPAIFMESTINPKILEQIASDNRIRIGGKLYADSLGDEKSPAATYYDMLKHNTDVIVTALTGENSPANPVTNRPKNSLVYFILVGILLFILVLVFRKLRMQ